QLSLPSFPTRRSSDLTRYSLAGFRTARLSPGCLKFIQRRFELRLEILVEFFFLPNRSKQSFFPCLQPVLKFQLVLLDSVDWDRIEVSVLHRPQHGYLFFDRDWVVLFLLKKLDNPLTAIESRSSRRVQIGTKLRKCS